MAEWRECTIADVCTYIYSGGTPNKKHEEYFTDGKIPWLNTGEISFNRIRKTENFITEVGLNNSSAKWVPANSVVVAMYGATAAKTAISKIDLTTNQACCNLIVNNEIADYRYVYYYLMNNYTQLSSLANGGAQQNLNAGIIKGFNINLPELELQKRIADMLSICDDKIELNNEINKNLAEMIQGLYQQQFGNLKIASSTGVLSDICSYSKDRIAVSELTVKNYFSTENMQPNKANALEASGLPTTALTTRCRYGDVLVSNIRPYFKKITYCHSECGCSTDVLCFTPSKFELSAFLYSTLYADKFFDYMVAGSKGTKMPRGDKQQIMNYPIAIPSDSELEAFNEISLPSLALINDNNEENSRLTALRNSLLPKLMSGELDVSSLDL